MADSSSMNAPDGGTRGAAPSSLLRRYPRIEPFPLLGPQLVPIGPIVLGEIDPHVHAALLRLHQGASHALRNGWSLDAAVDLALKALPSVEGDAAASTSDGSAPTSAPSEHDAYFCLTRLRARARASGVGETYARSIVLALRLYQTEARSVRPGSDPNAWRSLACALLGMLGRYLHLPAEATPLALATANALGRAADPMGRWIHGRQLSLMITQGLIWSLQTFEHSLVRERPASAESALEFTAELFDASACALRFSVDFSVGYYDNEIRPSLQAAQLPDGFGSASSPEQAQLEALLERLREALDAARRRFPASHAALAEARERVLDHQRQLRERFDSVGVGASATPVLLSAGAEAPVPIRR